MSAEPLAIVSCGLVSAAGVDDDDALASLLRAGSSALARASRIATPDPRWTGSVPDRRDEAWTPMSPLPDARAQGLCVDWAVAAGRSALARAGLDAATLGLVFATNLEDHPRPLPALAAEIADTLGLGGPRLVTSMACASSLAALALARLVLAEADATLVIASDVLTPRVVGGFAQLSLLCDEPCAPFSTRIGTSLGEGAAAFVLQRASAQLGAEALAWVRGEGLAADAFHAVAPEPGGRGTTAAVVAALAEAGCSAETIELIVAHGTGTAANDEAELRGLLTALGPGVVDTPIVALKSVFGHGQGAGAGLELGALLLGWARGFVPCTANFEAPRYGPTRIAAGRATAAEGPAPLILTPATRAELDHLPTRALQTSAGFGGSCAAVILDRDRPEPSPAAAPAPIFVRSWARVGWDADASIDWRRALRRVDLRAVDPCTRYLSLAVATALGRAHEPELGLVVAQPRSSYAAVARLRDEVERHGLEGASATAFCDPLIVMPAGACARALGLRGPYAVCVAEAEAAVLALGWAADLLRRRPACPGVIAAVVDEHLEDDRHGAAAFVLGREGAVRLGGWSVAAAGDSERALDRACAQADVERREILGLEQLVAPSLADGVAALLRGCEQVQSASGPVAVTIDAPRRAAVGVVLS